MIQSQVLDSDSQILYIETHITSMAASLVFKSGVLPEQISNSCYWKTHNSLLHSTQDVAWQSHDQSMYKLGLVDSPQQVLNFCVFLHVIHMTRIFMFSPVIQVLSH